MFPTPPTWCIFSPPDCTAWLYARNLLSYNHIRYVIQFWETGNLRQYPRQVSFTEEPIRVGVKLNLTF